MPRPTAPPRPLDGTRVVDLTHAYAGPLCTYNLALLGADVLKVEPPAGDDFRSWLPNAFVAINAGKRSVALDLKSADGRRVLDELLVGADVLVENYRPGVAAGFGLEWEGLHAAHPRLVFCSISGFGGEGPLRDAPAIEWAVQAAAGMTDSYVDEGSDPRRPGLAVVDAFTGFTAVSAILAALLQRERTGLGSRLDVAMLDAALALQSAPVADAANGADPHGVLPASGLFAAADRRLYLSATHQKWFERLCALIGAPELAADARFADRAGRTEHAAELHAEIESRLAARPAADWERDLRAAGLPASVVHSLPEAVRAPIVEQRGLLHTVQADGATATVMGAPFSLDGDRRAPDPAAVPGLGADTDAVLCELGRTSEEIAALREAGAVA